MTMKSKTTMKSTSVGAKFEVFGAHFGRIWGGFGVVLELGRHHLGGRKGTRTQVPSKGGGVLFLTLPFWPEKCLPGARREVPRGPENRPKRRQRKRQEAM